MLAAGGLGLAPVCKKLALEAGVSTLPLAVATTMIAALIALALGLTRPGRLLPASWSAGLLGRLLLVGGLGSGLVALLAILAMAETSATHRSLFQSLYPVATAVCARFLLGERLGRGSYLLVVLMCLGLLLMNVADGALSLGRSFWLLAATLPLIGLSDVFARRALADAEPGLVATGRLVSGAGVLLLSLPWIPAEAWSELQQHWMPVVPAGLAMALGALGLYRLMQLAGASLAAAFLALAPVVTATLEWLLLDRRFAGHEFVGIAIVVTAALLLAGNRHRLAHAGRRARKT